MIIEASQKSSALDAMMNLAKITCDRERFSNEIRCLRQALKRNEYDKENATQAVQPSGKKGSAELEIGRGATLKFQEAKSLKTERLLNNFKMKLIHTPAKKNLHMIDHQETILDQNFTA
jgi:hypothetical protein